MSRVHLDHNATTPIRPEARERLLEVLDELGGNASSLHASGRHARDLIDRARWEVAQALGVAEDELIFTASGTEANNLALRGVLEVAGEGAGLAVGAAEHASVTRTARALERGGHRLTWIGVDPEGRPRPVDVERALADERCRLVSVMAASNEVGALSPLEDIGGRVRDAERGVRFHTDATQALGRIPLDLRKWQADLATFSAHKVGGPLGVGLLWRRTGVELGPYLYGGEQESGLRPGTENVPAIASAARAIVLAVREQTAYRERVSSLSRELWRALCEHVPDARLLGPPIASTERLPNTLCVSFAEVDGKVITTRLDVEGLEVGAGSACASGSLEPSHVLVAMGLDDDTARSALRLSLGRMTTSDDVRRAVDILRKVFAPSRAS